MAKPNKPAKTVEAEKNNLVKRMFIATADQTYVTARAAYFHQLDAEFCWLAMHAVEKYLKAILLLNGQSAKQGGHNIVRLFRDVKSLHPQLIFEDLVQPLNLDVAYWREESAAKFVERLQRNGNPSNRYMTYGYVVHGDDIFKLDQVIWQIRRHCRPFHQTLFDGQASRELDMVEILRRHPQQYRVSGDLIIEKAVARRTPNEFRTVLLNLNIPFAPPSFSHTSSRWRTAGENPPMIRWFDGLKSTQTSEESKKAYRDCLKWALDNIQFSPADTSTMKSYLV